MTAENRGAGFWASGAAYERFMGRWSRLVAREFVNWLALPAGKEWLEVGCGTGSLTKTTLEQAAPLRIKGLDPSAEFIGFVRERVRDERANFAIGDAQGLPEADAIYDVAIGGLVLNFVPDPGLAIAEMLRVTRPGGCVALYVWDYAGRMELLRYFWDAAASLDPRAAELDEGRRFQMCKPGTLEDLFKAAGLKDVMVREIEVPTVFRDFDDYWSPFMGGQGPASGYAVSLSEDRQSELRERLRAALPIAADGTLHLAARAWAVRGFG